MGRQGVLDESSEEEGVDVMAEYVIDKTNLDLVEGVNKTTFDALAQRVTDAEGALTTAQGDITTLKQKEWALAGHQTLQEAGGATNWFLDVSVVGKTELFVRINTAKASSYGNGPYNIGWYLPLIALSDTDATHRYTFANSAADASNHYTVQAFIYSANVVRVIGVRNNGVTPSETGCNLMVYLR